ncbi:MAG: bifunctional diaminohydroxyphosphoribosylaminopyrimidine deaminase/5-amino-6-(5-phosphoribosylamino)uracil reductase RibD [Elusimicrobiota bacterium]
MKSALALAVRGRGRVHPNPMVGAVLVRNNREVGAGFHRFFGGPHAEAEALRAAGARARGATLYINLEPCSHWGKTPPCAEALAAAGVREVVAAMRDPNPLVAGRGFAFLRRHGIRVKTGVLEASAQRLNRAFVSWVVRKKPYVTLKVASSLDGRIATAGGESRWITSAAARSSGHHLRAEADAIAVGIHTVLRDNPSLLAHGRGRDPQSVIFDSRLRISPCAKVLQGPSPAWILSTVRAPRRKRAILEAQGVHVEILPSSLGGRVNVKAALVWLAKKGIAHLLVEGGGELHASFLEEKAADEVIWFIAPKILGGLQAKPAIGGRGVRRLKDAWPLKGMSMTSVGKDWCIRGNLRD